MSKTFRIEGEKTFERVTAVCEIYVHTAFSVRALSSLSSSVQCELRSERKLPMKRAIKEGD